MKKYFLFASLLVTLFITACSNEFEVTTDWKDIPVVYGLLDLSDKAHYIRLEKAFLDPKGDAFDFAKIADSLYYENATVKLEKLSTNQILTLQRVDGNLEGLVRDSGIFADAPNWLYKIDSLSLDLKPGERIRIIIDRGNGLPEVTSEAAIIGNAKLNSPSATSDGFSFQVDLGTDLRWTAHDSAIIFDVTLFFQYAEYPFTDPSKLEFKTIEWPWAKGLRRETSENVFKIEQDGFAFYDLLRNSIPVDETKKRIFVGIDVEITSGGAALRDYVNVGLANTGITASQDIPTFTNMSEGKGVFSSINKFRIENIGLVSKTRDTLRAGYLTKNLNF